VHVLRRPVRGLGEYLIAQGGLMWAGTPHCSSEPSLEPSAICAEQALQKLHA